jgi:uncharacterized repeat protein (TIGR01451 family)
MLVPWLVTDDLPIASAFTVFLDETFTNASTSAGQWTSGGGSAPGSGFACLTAATASAPGDPVTFTLTVRNTSNEDARNVVVVDPLPASFTFVSLTTSEGSCTCATTVRCDLGTLNAGRTATITIVTRTTSQDSYTNTATVSADQIPEHTASVTISVTVMVRQPENDDEDEERRNERRNEEARHRSEQEEGETQGDVVAVVCTDNGRRPDDPVDQDDGRDVPYVVIVTLDGNQKVRLRADARRACQGIRIGDYLEANGEKQSEVLFDADDVKVRGARP